MLHIQEITLDQIQPNPFQARTFMNSTRVARLAENIKDVGLREPPQARAMPDQPGQYQLVFGHTRLAAFQLLRTQFPADPRWTQLPLIIVQLDDRQMFESGIIENRHSEGISAIAIGLALEAYVNTFNASQTECGKLFGLSQGAVSNHIRLLRLPPPVRDLIDKGLLTERLARMLITLSPEDALRIANGAVRRHDGMRLSFVLQQVRVCREKSGKKSLQGRKRRLVEANTSDFAPDTCPHCWKTPKTLARKGNAWLCGDCRGVVRVGLALPKSGASPKDA